jgi:alkylation response protein AidB-like acyl-CoA dehydrogenase
MAASFHMLKTRSVGGMELKPSIFAQVTEAIAAADGSTGGWCVRATAAPPPAPIWNRMWRRRSSARRTAFSPGARPARTRRSQPTAAIRITGTWRFASGSQNATYLGAHMRIKGTGELRSFLFPKSSAKMKDIWHTLGLRGTASNEYSVNDLFVPEERAMHRDDPRYRQSDAFVYRYTSNQLYSIGFGGVGLGIARGMIDAFLNLPATKQSRGASKPMRENNVVQSQFASARRAGCPLA